MSSIMGTCVILTFLDTLAKGVEFGNSFESFSRLICVTIEFVAIAVDFHVLGMA